jgi:hypothetical protein
LWSGTKLLESNISFLIKKTTDTGLEEWLNWSEPLSDKLEILSSNPCAAKNKQKN